MARFEKGNPGGPRGSHNAINVLLDDIAVEGAQPGEWQRDDGLVRANSGAVHSPFLPGGHERAGPCVFRKLPETSGKQDKRSERRAFLAFSGI